MNLFQRIYGSFKRVFHRYGCVLQPFISGENIIFTSFLKEKEIYRTIGKNLSEKTVTISLSFPCPSKIVYVPLSLNYVDAKWFFCTERIWTKDETHPLNLWVESQRIYKFIIEAYVHFSCLSCVCLFLNLSHDPLPVFSLVCKLICWFAYDRNLHVYILCVLE